MSTKIVEQIEMISKMLILYVGIYLDNSDTGAPIGVRCVAAFLRFAVHFINIIFYCATPCSQPGNNNTH